MSNLESKIDWKVGEGAITELLKNSGIEPHEVGKAHRIKDFKLYQGYIKNSHDEIETVDMASVVLSPAWEEGPKWELVTPGPSWSPPAVKNRQKGGVKKSDYETAFIIPDMQIGFYHGADGQLVSTHDERAIDLVLQIIEDEQPDRIVMVGDNVDLPEMSRYRTTPAFAQTTQATIDYTTTLMYRYRLAAPLAEIVWIAGNHDERLPNYLLDNAAAAYGLRQGKHPAVEADTPYPVLSIPHLCQLDLSGVTFLPGYPAAEYWINPDLKIIHGTKVHSSGSTAIKYLNDEKVSVVYGHIHRIEDNFRTFPQWGGPRTIRATSPGTLAKVDGAVPSVKGGTDLYGRPLTVVENWQQGFGFVRFNEDEFFYSNHPIQSYRTDFGGEVWVG